MGPKKEALLIISYLREFKLSEVSKNTVGKNSTYLGEFKKEYNRLAGIIRMKSFTYEGLKVSEEEMDNFAMIMLH